MNVTRLLEVLCACRHSSLGRLFTIRQTDTGPVLRLRRKVLPSLIVGIFG